MWRVPEGGDAAASLGPGTRAPLRAVPGRTRRRAFWNRPSGARGRDACDFAEWRGLCRRGRRSRAAPVVARQALVSGAVSNPRGIATRPPDLRLDRAAAALSGAGNPGSLGSLMGENAS